MLLTLFSAVVVTLALGISFAEFAKTLPDLKEQAVTKSPETSKLYAADGTLLTDLFVEQNRIIVPLTKVQPHLQNAVVAIEDQRFYTHKGVDAEAIARAALTNFEQGVIAEGGSTITQQYVKNTLIKPHKTLSRKIKEAYLAYQVEKKHSKKDILEKYLNTVYFGVNAYGVETASQTFFGKQAAHLSLAEAALLAGLIKSPNNYSPYTYPERALARRSAVLRRMVQQSYITEAEARLARAEPLTVKPIEQRPVPAKYFVDYVKRLILDDSRYGSTPSQRANFLFKGGLRIYTTLDLEMQAHAEEAANMLDRPDDPSVAIAAVEPSTGYVKALVGGRDFETSKFNLAIQGKRQPGSSFKIFVLAS
ncbi:MAG: transglycosylase domain-containing protein, partial [Terriglobia bacterium]